MQNQTDQNTSIPRVNRAVILNYIGRDVRLVGKIVKIDVATNQLTLQTSDNGVIQVLMSNTTKHTSDVVEIFGRVTNDGSVKEFSAIDFPNNFDLNNYDQLITIMQQHKDIFGLA